LQQFRWNGSLLEDRDPLFAIEFEVVFDHILEVHYLLKQFFGDELETHVGAVAFVEFA